MSGEVRYALTDEGLKLAVIDVTNPAFAVTATEAELEAMEAKFLVDAKKMGKLPDSVREQLKASFLGRGMMEAAGTFLPGLSTYLLKLGPGNLGEHGKPIDKILAASFPIFTMRLRLQDMARMLADGLVESLERDARRPLLFVNVAGGPAADSWNTLIVLQAERPELLAGREITVAILDRDEHGPSFGARAVEALCAEAGPLSGLRPCPVWRHIYYPWTEVERLGGLLRELGASDAVCAISSEGGLFEYGLDDEIIANLRQLRDGTPGDTRVVGSVTRDSETMRSTRGSDSFTTIPRTIEAFRALAERGGWAVEKQIDRPYSFNVRLVKS
jgi:hypothetical protein